MRSASPLDTASQAPAGAAAGFNPADPFGLSAREAAQLRVRRDATWLADYWGIELDANALADPQATWVPARLRYGSEDWLVRFCLGQADRIKLEAPSELAEEVLRRASAALEAIG